MSLPLLQGPAGLVEQAPADVDDAALCPAAASRHPSQVVVLVQRQREGIERTLALIRGGQELGGAGQGVGQRQGGRSTQRAEKVASLCHAASLLKLTR